MEDFRAAMRIADGYHKPHQAILIHPALWLPHDTPIGELFVNRAIEIVVTRVMERREVRLGIEADRRFVVWREELTELGWEGPKRGP